MLKVKVSSEPSLSVSAKGPASAVVKAHAISIVAGSSINVSGASVGQIIKIAEVDEEGKPTAWEAFWLSEETVSRDDVLSALDETGLITPVASVENVVYSDETGKIFVL